MPGLQKPCHETAQAYFRLPQSHLQASIKHMYALASKPTKDKLNQDKKADVTAAGAHSISNSRIQWHIHIKIISPNLDESRKWTQDHQKSRNSG